MASLAAVVQQKAVSVFRSAVTAHAGQVIPAIVQRIERVLGEGEVVPDLFFFFSLLGRIPAEVMGRFIEGDKAHLDELTNDLEPRERRDEVGGRVRSKLINIRSITDGLFGPVRGAEILATDGPTAEVAQSELLWRQGDHTATRLEKPALATPSMTTASLQFDPATLGSELREDVDAFRQVLDECEQARREAEKTLLVREELSAESATVLRGCRLILEGMLLLGNRPDLVFRLRRAMRRRRRAAGSPPVPDAGETPTAPGDQPPAPDEASDSESESPSTP
jgi:hypothetical protein